jgi:hypothetical protein
MLPTIVFVHLNSPVPLYLRLNILSTIKKFPEAKIVLIHNEKKRNRIQTNLRNFEYQPGVRSLSIENSLNHPKDFRNNFWFSAIQRFDALHAYMEQSDESILHIESDVILSKDFPLKKFIIGEMKIAYPIVADNRGVASSIFIRDLYTAEKLIRLTEETTLVNSNATDMEILAEFSKKNPDVTFLLAFGPESVSAYDESFVLERVRPAFEQFSGVFDGNDIGVYLFGTDPRNARGVSFLGTSIQGNYARINQWNFEFDSLRQFISLKFDDAVKPIYSVHATSKKLTLFFHYTQSYVIRRHLRKNYHIRDKKFFVSIASKMLLRKILKLLKT